MFPPISWPIWDISIHNLGPLGLSCFHELTCSWSNSTDLPARSPTLRIYQLVVQHAWTPTLNLPAHSSLKCEHRTYEPPRSYPHIRVQQIRTSSPTSITHLSSPLRTSLLVTNPTYPWPRQQDHPCKSICNRSLPPDYRLPLPKRCQMKTCSRLPGGNPLSLSATRLGTPLFVAHIVASYFNLECIQLSNYVNLSSYQKVTLLITNYIILLFLYIHILIISLSRTI